MNPPYLAVRLRSLARDGPQKLEVIHCVRGVIAPVRAGLVANPKTNTNKLSMCARRIHAANPMVPKVRLSSSRRLTEGRPRGRRALGGRPTGRPTPASNGLITFSRSKRYAHIVRT